MPSEILLVRHATLDDPAGYGTFIGLVIPANSRWHQELRRRHLAARRGLKVPVVCEWEDPVEYVPALGTLVGVGWHLFPWINKS